MDHDFVYRTLPANVESLLSKVDIDKTVMYNRNQEPKTIHGNYENISESIWQERNQRWSKEKYIEFRLTCERLLKLIIQYKEELPEEMFIILYEELNAIIKQAENMKEGEIEL